MMSRGSGLPSPRGMMRGAVSGPLLMGRGSPAKASPAWGGRNSRQMYGRPGFLRGYSIIHLSFIFLLLSVFVVNVIGSFDGGDNDDTNDMWPVRNVCLVLAIPTSCTPHSLTH